MVIVTGSDDAAAVMLVVGNIRGWTQGGRILPEITGFHFAGYHEVNAELLARLNPDVVLSALMADSFDALDLARRLVDAGFVGRYRAVTIALPNPSAVRVEVHAIAPDLDFDLFVIDGSLSPDLI